ncbi:flagellar biosynthesis anti-sigma factor FlgM [Desulfurobacterium sp.]
MKIEGLQNNIAGIEPQHLRKQLRKRARNGQTDEATLQESAVSVNESADVEKAVKEQVQLQTIDEQRIQEIKEAIASGNYPVDIHKISESILKEFLGS